MTGPGFVLRTSGLLRPLFLGWAVALICLPGVAQAQVAPPGERPEVSGTVSESDGRPVLGALVALENTDGRRLRSVLTDGDGRFRLRAPGPGAYRLRVERLGYRSTISDPFALDEGEVLRRDLQVAGAPIRLREVDVVVAADRRCAVTPEEGSLLADLWEQARQALHRVEATEEEGAYRFHLRRYQRSVEIRTGRVAEERWMPGGSSLRSFESAPVEELLATGWIRRGEGTDLVYFGPDLPVLLSPEFQQAFCLRVRNDPDRAGEVGIGFEPLEAGAAPSIRGTLWLDAGSVELRELEFQYTRHLVNPELPPALHELFGGRVAFRGLPDGRWVVDRWVLRMPEFRRTGRVVGWSRPSEPDAARELDRIRRTVERAPRTWQEMIGDGRLRFRDEGGDVERIRTRAGVLLPGREAAAVAGVVWDSLQVPRQPLVGATVRIEGTEATASTTSGGRFHLTVPLEGRYRIVFDHPLADSLGLAPMEGVDVTLRPGLVAEAELALPSRTTVLARPCRDPARDNETGILVGRVLDEALRSPVPGATVRIRPLEAAAGAPAYTTHSEVDGTFRFCEVPAGSEYELVASTFGDEGPGRRLVLPERGRVLELDALVDLGQRGRIVGRVREGEGGPWVPGATIRLEGPERRTGMSDRDGRFRLEELRPGTYRVRVEHLAYRDVEAELEVPPGDATVTAELRMLRDAVALAPIHVEVEARSPLLVQVGYYERQRAGSGTFIDREEIERRRPVRTGDLFHILPRANVVGGQILFRGQAEIFGALAQARDGVTGEDEAGPVACQARVFVDGVRLPDDRIDDIHPDEIEAIEAYAGPARTPIQFVSADSACGVILVWLKNR